MTGGAPTDTASTLEARLTRRALALGFDEMRIADAVVPRERQEAYARFIRAGRHGGMAWLARDPQRRATPRGMWPAAESVVVCATNYGPEHDPRPLLERRDRGNISVYARNRDYHQLIKGRLKQLASWLHAQTGDAVKVFVDTAPLLEKPLAQRAGLGWQGKHTNLVSRRHGSWLFMGEILTERRLEPDAAETDRCGACRRCLDVCPTDAFPAPYELDARRCISYLTIEHDGPIPRALRKPIGNRIYGCDDCLAVCPWNKFAHAAAEAKLQARADLEAPRLADLLVLDDAGFRALFSGSPIKRIGRDRFLRNVLIAAGNSADPSLVPHIAARLGDTDAVVRATAVWALRLLLPQAEAVSCLQDLRAAETDARVLAEFEGVS